ncbi:MULTISPECIES: single-stranded DNA-binding protein [Kitasatospora]|uniref:Single-stranded DNA-binding protein n=1 Tax=Kitasatospora setae (strain ATCC 33774 / DSM 43861 / JCM 3304 / KCC A-0304 / NBRC 14216 / KM-6054) TaxID=452652 RepID=E4NIA2_KITSK|nr:MULTISPECIES: single-stranded DNA-binding protein [Kitasatospora]BAJ31232.1 putative single-stranded DNA-binding protein [Kitasatospora setae KM-6054]
MDEALVTIVGNAASGVTYRETPGGVAVANFRLAARERRYDRERGDWTEGETTWVTVVAWRRLAVNVVSSVNKGDPLLVSGRLRVREWGEEGSRRTEVEIDARSVGHDLARGTSAFRRGLEGKSPPQQGGSGASGLGATGPAGPGGPAAGGSGAGGPRAVRLVEEAVPDWIVAAVAARRGAGEGGAADGGAAGEGGADVTQEVLN